MDTRLVALKLVLDAANVPPDIKTVDDRKRVQKAIYLIQRAGVDLGYRFGWYLMGPYSPGLTRDYYGLAEALESDDRDWETQELRSPLKDRIEKLLPLMEAPTDFPLSPEDWLELTASFHFLREIRGLNEDETLKVLVEQKPNLAPHWQSAARAVAQMNLSITAK